MWKPDSQSSNKTCTRTRFEIWLTTTLGATWATKPLPLPWFEQSILLMHNHCTQGMPSSNVKEVEHIHCFGTSPPFRLLRRRPRKKVRKFGLKLALSMWASSVVQVLLVGPVCHNWLVLLPALLAAKTRRHAICFPRISAAVLLARSCA